MARCYELLCDDCKLSIWIGQANYGARPVNEAFYIYTVEPTLAVIQTFFIEHLGHHLRMVHDERTPADYSRVDNESGKIESPEV